MKIQWGTSRTLIQAKSIKSPWQFPFFFFCSTLKHINSKNKLISLYSNQNPRVLVFYINVLPNMNPKIEISNWLITFYLILSKTNIFGTRKPHNLGYAMQCRRGKTMFFLLFPWKYIECAFYSMGPQFLCLEPNSYMFLFLYCIFFNFLLNYIFILFSWICIFLSRIIISSFGTIFMLIYMLILYMWSCLESPNLLFQCRPYLWRKDHMMIQIMRLMMMVFMLARMHRMCCSEIYCTPYAWIRGCKYRGVKIIWCLLC